MTRRELACYLLLALGCFLATAAIDTWTNLLQP